MPYPGNKEKFADRIEATFPPHKIYVEPFGGAGGMLLNKTVASQKEVMNDIDSSLINLFETIRKDCDGLINNIRKMLISEQIFKELQSNTDRSQLEDATWTVYKRYYSFGSAGRSFAVGAARLTPISRVIENILSVKKRISNVVFYCRDWKYLKVFDSKDTLFFFDPPYWGTEVRNYAKESLLIDMEEFRSFLRKLKGSFVFTCEPIDYFNEFNSIVLGERNKAGGFHSLGKKKTKDTTEHLYTNFKVSEMKRLF